MQSITLKTIQNLILFFMVVFDKGEFCESMRSDYVLLNQAYTFPGNASGCHHAEWRKKLPIDTTITTYRKHACTKGKGFEEEFICKDKHLLLKSARYSDQGPYEFICDGEKTPVNLDVLYALNASAVEMDNISLSCYAHNAKDVTWLHYAERVLFYKLGGSVNLSKDYEGRASLENNCFKTGDLSLTIARVRKEDNGLYRCFVGDSTTKGNPHAHVLHMKEKRSGLGDQIHSNCNEVTLIVLTVVFGLVSVISVTTLITTNLRKRPSTSAQRSEGDATEIDCMLTPVISTTSPTTESQPVQESESGNKPSNTKPF